MVQAEDILIDLAAEEAQEAGGGLKKLRDVTKELEGIVPEGEGQMHMMSTADKIPVWNIHSGRRSDILSDQLRFQLKKRFPANHPLAGQRVYSLKPVPMPTLPEKKCWLHPEHEMRGWLDSIGLKGKTCMADKIPTDYAVTTHMGRKHSGVYNLIVSEQGKEETRRQTDLQERQLAAMERIGNQAVGPIAEEIASDGVTLEAPTLYYCRTEGCERFFDKEPNRNAHEYKCPLKKAHKET